MAFYLMFTLLIAFGRGRSALLIKLTLLGMLCWSIYSHFGRRAYDAGVLETMNIYELYLGFPFLLEFLAGAIIAERLRQRPYGLSWSLLLAGIALWAVSGYVNNNQFGGNLFQGYFILWRVLLFGTASVFIVAGLVRLENTGWVLFPRFGVLAGGASYAIYLSHTLILDATQNLGLIAWLQHYPTWLAQTALVCLMALIVAYSMAHYRWLERPLHSAFQRWLKA